MTDRLLHWIGGFLEQAIDGFGYGGLTMLMVLENLVPPIPSELVVPLAGYRVATGHLHAGGALIACTAGSVVGAWLLYTVGARVGEARIRRWLSRYGRRLGVPERDLDRGLDLFRHRSGTVIFWSRLVPGLRSLISIPAGIARMDIRRFLLYTTLGSLVWNGALLAAGFVLSEQWPRVVAMVDRYEHATLVVLAAAVLALVSHAWLRRARLRGAGDEPTTPGA